MALKTNYKDYLPPETGRKFKITDAGSGLSSIEDATEYLQQGDTFGAEDINATNRQVNALCAGYTAAETAMPYVWLDGKTVYRQCLELAVSDFDQSTTEQFYPDYAGTITETSTTQLNSKTSHQLRHQPVLRRPEHPAHLQHAAGRPGLRAGMAIRQKRHRLEDLGGHRPVPVQPVFQVSVCDLLHQVKEKSQ